MKNKVKFNVFVISALLLLSVLSCSKFDDNDSISITTRTNRLSKVWNIDNYKLNNVDLTSLYSGYSETYTKDKAYSYQWGIIGGTGTWAFQNNDKEIRITGINNQSSTTLYILKLENKSLWYYYMKGNEKNEFHMIAE